MVSYKFCKNDAVMFISC